MQILGSLQAIFVPGRTADGVSCAYSDPEGQSEGFGSQAQAAQAMPRSRTPGGGGREGIWANLLQWDLESTGPKRI